MSSSSSDSDSDQLEPIRRIKINLKPRDNIKRDGADVDAIKASVEAWRPLGPRPHQSLTRRQSSLSSVSSLSYTPLQGGSTSNTITTKQLDTSNTNSNISNNQQDGLMIMKKNSSSSTTSEGNNCNNIDHSENNTDFMRSSPSCSSLVREFNNRTSFSNFMPNASRTSSPLTFMVNNNYNDSVPIAIAIQESIELIVKEQRGPDPSEIMFESRALGNIKFAFPNTFARLCSSGSKLNSELKLRLHSTDSVLRYYASNLVKDNLTNGSGNSLPNSNGDISNDQKDDSIDMNATPTKTISPTKIVEIDMVALTNQLTQQYNKSPNGRYYNVDLLRYQIAPVDRFDKCPLQVCAYWRVEPKVIKLRIDFKHSNQSELNLERFREIVFSVDLSNLMPSKGNSEIVTYEPQAIWNRSTRQLIWKFDDLLSYYKTDGYGSLLAKLDFRNCESLDEHQLSTEHDQVKAPKAVDVRFLVVDSTLSKLGISIDSSGYRVSLLKKEVRTGRYRSEPYIF